MTEMDQVADRVDRDRPAPARIYDYLLGGRNNFQADRDAAGRITALVPELRDCAWANRGFHQRAAKWIAQRGIRQFIDIGSGLPTVGNTHEVVHQVDPQCRVVYADNDPMVREHATAMLEGHEDTVRVIQGDLRDPDSVLANPDLRALIDFSQPAGLLMTAVVHFVADESDPWQLLARYLGGLAPGSYLALSHATVDFVPEDQLSAVSRVEGIYRQISAQLHPRSYGEVAKFFTGLDLVEPGVVPVRQWRSEWNDQNEGKVHLSYGGVGHKP